MLFKGINLYSGDPFLIRYGNVSVFSIHKMSTKNEILFTCAWLLHPKSRNQGKGMLEVHWLAVELREWFASTRSTFFGLFFDHMLVSEGHTSHRSFTFYFLSGKYIPKAVSNLLCSTDLELWFILDCFLEDLFLGSQWSGDSEVRQMAARSG